MNTVTIQHAAGSVDSVRCHVERFSVTEDNLHESQ